jgi:adenine-specific DNA methylase
VGGFHNGPHPEGQHGHFERRDHFRSQKIIEAAATEDTMNTVENGKRLIEVDFPLEQVSLDSVHEKNVRHGHISTLHIWPARRPLAASRAALIATLLPDPGNDDERKAIYRRLAGDVVETIETKKAGGRTVEKRKRETRGGILHWGQESGPDLDWFRGRIREAYGGRTPKVLDPFAGGGAIPLEAIRLGCDVTAADINPVAWFILKCTLEYPQKLAGKTLPLPDFALTDCEFMESFLKAKGFKGADLKSRLAKLGLYADGEAPQSEPLARVLQDDPLPEADLAWQVRAWGRWVLVHARRKLAHRYPTYAEFVALEPGGRQFERRPLVLLEPDDNGETDVGPLNAAFGEDYLDDPRNPRWVAKPTVAYLWARTVRCKGCRAPMPLLKTRWLVKKDNKRVLLTMEPNADRTGVVFGIETGVPVVGGNATQRREHDNRKGAGTMSRSGVQCACCPTIMTMEDLKLEGRADRLSTVLTAIVVDGPKGKDYRLPTDYDLVQSGIDRNDLARVFSRIPYNECSERLIEDAKRNTWCVQYGIDEFRKLFSPRQQIALGELVSIIRSLPEAMQHHSNEALWIDATKAFLACTLDRFADRASVVTTWQTNAEKLGHTFVRWALPMAWDFAESNPLADSTGGFVQAIEWVDRYISHALVALKGAPVPDVLQTSAMQGIDKRFDLIITDPPYYDAIGYAVLMDFFYVWLRRLLFGDNEAYDRAFSNPLGPKWDRARSEGELVDDASRFDRDKHASKRSYEDGMAQAFQACHRSLNDGGRFVVVFANKQPDAWETLVGALIRSGFVVDGSWPIQTERQSRTRAMSSAALASSVWLVCKKRPAARAGWDTAVLGEMNERIQVQLRAFWDAGIRGPDFVWAATGPALEAFSRYPIVKKVGAPGAEMSVSEFLREVRRIVVDFVVGRVLRHDGSAQASSGLDDITTYYLLHRSDFGLDDAPIGACILYALSCNLSDSDLADRFDILSRSAKTPLDDLEEDDVSDEAGDGNEESAGSGSKVRLKPWNQRKAKWLGYEGPGERPVPLIDQSHRLMHLWRAGDEVKVNGYLNSRGLKRSALFAQLLQALIELSPQASEERSTLESLSNHIAAQGGITTPFRMAMEV